MFLFFVFFFLVYMFVISTGVHTTARPQAPSTFSPPWLISASSSLVTLVLPFFFLIVLYCIFCIIFFYIYTCPGLVILLFLFESRSLGARGHWRGREAVTSHF
uniref:Secreted protein n=1 Tax=Ixodes ricinus TaxID=34613 RepID=A0A6B0U7L9_IXORI